MTAKQRNPKARPDAATPISAHDLAEMTARAVDHREARNGFTEAMEIVNFTLPKAFSNQNGPTADEVRHRVIDEIYAPMLDDREFTESAFEALKQQIFDDGFCIDVTHEVVAYCVFAVRAYFHDDQALSWSYACDARYWAGVVMILAKQRALPASEATAQMLARLRSEQGRTAAHAKLSRDPKQAAKAEAFNLWQEWHANRMQYKSGAAFARHVVSALPAIENTKTVERWVTQWRKDAKTKKQASS